MMTVIAIIILVIGAIIFIKMVYDLVENSVGDPDFIIGVVYTLIMLMALSVLGIR